MTRRYALEGVRILDLSQVAIGPYTTLLLASLGAQVIKVESNRRPDTSRGPVKPAGEMQLKQYPEDGPGEHPWNRTAYYNQRNRGKLDITLDFSRPEGKDLLKRLAAVCDAAVENYRASVMERQGLGWEVLREANPHLVYLKLSSQGNSGPERDYGSLGSTLEQTAGLASITGYTDGIPLMTNLVYPDPVGGILGVGALIAGLRCARRTGKGQFIDASLLDNYFHMHELAVPVLSLRPDKFQPKRNGRMYQPSAPYGIFYANGGYVMICVTPHQWPAFCRAIGRPDLKDDSRFKEERLRVRNREELTQITEAWLKTFPSVEAALEALDKERVPCAPILTVEQAMSHPHHRQRGTVRRVHDPIMGEFDIPGMPVKFRNWPDRTDVKASLLGQDNDDILRNLLGMSDSQISRLYEQKVLVKEPALQSK